MRAVRGLAAAREVLCSGRGLGLDKVPPQARARTENLFGEPLEPAAVVDRIVAQVREKGDAALAELSLRLDEAAPSSLEVPRAVIEDAHRSVPADVLEALNTAAERIRRYHEACLPRGWIDLREGYGQLVNPTRRVGAYVPGGTALYPSTVLMIAIPARVAGVEEVVVCTPPGPSGTPSPVVLAAADVAGVDRVFAVGGAQAIAAMAYGTETVPAVDMICGPGNVFVTLAKKHVYGDVGIDGLYGPTETLIVADETANPTLCAADLVAQAEHDTMAQPVLVTTSPELADAVEAEADVRAERIDRSAIAGASLEQRGVIAVVDDLDEAMALANDFAPEHISLMVRDPWGLAKKVRNAGAIFIGELSHEVLGDYVAGPSHVMPTGRTARFSSGIGVHTFLKTSPIIALDREAASKLSRPASLIARAEGLTGHAEAAEVRDELI